MPKENRKQSFALQNDVTGALWQPKCAAKLHWSANGTDAQHSWDHQTHSIPGAVLDINACMCWVCRMRTNVPTWFWRLDQSGWSALRPDFLPQVTEHSLKYHTVPEFCVDTRIYNQDCAGDPESRVPGTNTQCARGLATPTRLSDWPERTAPILEITLKFLWSIAQIRVRIGDTGRVTAHFSIRWRIDFFKNGMWWNWLFLAHQICIAQKHRQRILGQENVHSLESSLFDAFLRSEWSWAKVVRKSSQFWYWCKLLHCEDLIFHIQLVSIF